MQITIDKGNLININETLVANVGYTLPDNITVLGADNTYNNTTGEVELTNLTSEITLTATGVAGAFDSTIITNNCVCDRSSESGLSGNYTAIITANDGYYLTSVVSTLGTVAIASDKHTATITISNITADFTITAQGSAVTYKKIELSPNNNGVVDYGTVLLPRSTFPECPASQDGTYVLQCTVSSGVMQYQWVQLSGEPFYVQPESEPPAPSVLNYMDQ